MYEFPTISHMDDVLPSIEGCDDFIVAERDWGYVINYLISTPDTFPSLIQKSPTELKQTAIRRECRGLLFYKDGSIMARRLHKFFNVNEREETQFASIDFSKPHRILEKLDGSMITPVRVAAMKSNNKNIGGYIRWGTKMGITDVSMGAEEFVARNPHYEKMASECLENGLTPIFEWCSRKQRIVIDYPEDRLVLIAIRNTVSGAYMNYRSMVDLAVLNDIDVVKAYDGNAESMAHLMDELKDQEGIEGYIIRFDDGHMLKIKGEWYLNLHRAKDELGREKNVIQMLVTGRIDDVKSFLLEDDKHKIEDFERLFWQGINHTVKGFEDYYNDVLVKNSIDRKTWAIEHMDKQKQINQFYPTIIFAMYDGKQARNLVLDIIHKHTGTQTKVDSVRCLWGEHRWNYYFDGDA